MSFTCVDTHYDEVYALSKKTVYVYKHSGSSWVEVHKFDVTLNDISLSIRNNKIFTAQRISLCSMSAGFITVNQSNSKINDHKITVYSLSGELLQTHSVPGPDNTVGHSGAVAPQVMSEKGEFSVLELQPPASQPRSAVLFNSNLYVLSSSNRILKYVPICCA